MFYYEQQISFLFKVQFYRKHHAARKGVRRKRLGSCFLVLQQCNDKPCQVFIPILFYVSYRDCAGRLGIRDLGVIFNKTQLTQQNRDKCQHDVRGFTEYCLYLPCQFPKYLMMRNCSGKRNTYLTQRVSPPKIYKSAKGRIISHSFALHLWEPLVVTRKQGVKMGVSICSKLHENVLESLVKAKLQNVLIGLMGYYVKLNKKSEDFRFHKEHL